MCPDAVCVRSVCRAGRRLSLLRCSTRSPTAARCALALGRAPHAAPTPVSPVLESLAVYRTACELVVTPAATHDAGAAGAHPVACTGSAAEANSALYEGNSQLSLLCRRTTCCCCWPRKNATSRAALSCCTRWRPLALARRSRRSPCWAAPTPSYVRARVARFAWERLGACGGPYSRRTRLLRARPRRLARPGAPRAGARRCTRDGRVAIARARRMRAAKPLGTLAHAAQRWRTKASRQPRGTAACPLPAAARGASPARAAAATCRHGALRAALRLPVARRTSRRAPAARAGWSQQPLCCLSACTMSHARR
jgi:hypothetical protein